MGLQTIADLEPLQRSRTTSNGRVNNGDAEGKGATARGGGPYGNTPIHHHLPSSKFESPPLETSVSQDPDTSTTISGPCNLDTVAGRSGALRTHSSMIRSLAVDNQLQALLIEVRFLVEHVREQQRQVSLAEQWQFAAAVVDRLFLVGFSVFNIICTITILLAAPSFGEALSKDFI